MTFNVYLEAILQSVPILATAIKDKKLFAYANDLLMVADLKEETQNLIRAISQLKYKGLKINSAKSKILDDTGALKDVKKHVEDVPSLQ